MAEKSFVYETLLRFLEGYFLKRDRESILEMTTEDVYCIGLQGQAPAFNREDFGKLLESHIAVDSASAAYRINAYQEKAIGEGNWICYCELETYMDMDGEKLNLSWWGITVGVQKEGGSYKFGLIHLSEMKNWAERGKPCGNCIQILQVHLLSHCTDIWRNLPGIRLPGYITERPGKF